MSKCEGALSVCKCVQGELHECESKQSDSMHMAWFKV